MKKILLVLIIVLLFGGCASAQRGADELDMAIRDASDYLNDNLPRGSKIVILNIQSSSAALSDYIIDELIANAVNDKNFSVVDRQQLDLIRMEQNFQWSGEVDDRTALEVGRFFGAQTIVSGRVSQIDDRYRMNIRALNVKTAQVQGQYNRNIAAGRTITALMRSGGSGSGTAYGLRSTGGKTNQTVTTQPAQTYKIGDTGPAGGIVFYDKGNNSGGWRYLEAAPANTERELYFWYSESPWGLGNKDRVGDGLENTRNFLSDMQKKGGGINSVVWYVTNLNINGFDDWYIPSFDELLLMYANLYQRNLGNFRERDYWHSSQQGVVIGAYNFREGERRHGYGYENDKRLIRAIRRF